ncbi:MAG: hypothetical protein AAGF92_17235 [Myxococcota bacterium]
MTVLMAGASGGLGPVLARELTDAGMTLYETMRNPAAHAGEHRPDTGAHLERVHGVSTDRKLAP